MTLDKSKWPNGLKEDNDGYTIFYPLGTNKINIADVNWPEGHKLISPFVYDENDKLIDFIDTKAMVVTGNDTTTTIPYNHIEVDFSSILEGTLNIDAPNASTNVVKWNRYPADLLPAGYTHVEYLESTGTQWIDTGLKVNNETEVKCDFLFSEYIQYGALFGARDGTVTNSFVLFANVNGNARFDFAQRQEQLWPIELSKLYSALANKNGIIINGYERVINNSAVFECIYTCFVFGVNSWGSPMLDAGRVYSFSISRNGQLQLNLIPALDPTGVPCMYDIISQEPFYNAGTGQFLYPGAETQVVTSDLDETFYAKMTPHGIKRLYKVPSHVDMSKDEYAIENGFKQLVEPPMPEEGYWRSEWTETDTQIICNWIETEAPTEENT